MGFVFVCLFWGGGGGFGCVFFNLGFFCLIAGVVLLLLLVFCLVGFFCCRCFLNSIFFFNEIGFLKLNFHNMYLPPGEVQTV